HFFTVATLGEALVDARFEVTDVQTVDTGHWHPEFAELWRQLPPAVHEWLQGNPAGKAFQVVMRAVPSEERKPFADPFRKRQQEWLNRGFDTAVPAAPAPEVPWWKRWFS